jgi:hypothetical protein
MTYDCPHDFKYSKALDGCHQFGHKERCTLCGETREDWSDRDLSSPYSSEFLNRDCEGCQKLEREYGVSIGYFEQEFDQNLFGNRQLVPVYSTITEDQMLAEMAAS